VKNMKLKRYLDSVKVWLQLIFRPPTVGFIDSIVFLVACFFTGILIVPYCVVTRKTLRKGLAIVFPRIMLKDLTVSFRGWLFKTRMRKVDILLLSGISEDYLDSHFHPGEGNIIIDCGSHIGKYTIPFSKAVGHTGKVIAIEPNVENYNTLVGNIKRNKCTNVVTFNAAVYSHNGDIFLFDSTDDAGYTVMDMSEEKADGLRKAQKGTSVVARTIDSIFEELGLSRCDFLKIDVEGAEVEVLRGALEVISKSPSIRIFVEVRHDHENEVDAMLQGRFNKCELLGTSKYYSEKMYSVI
jgi:FkbM family methyltransferase